MHSVKKITQKYSKPWIHLNCNCSVHTPPQMRQALLLVTGWITSPGQRLQLPQNWDEFWNSGSRVSIRPDRLRCLEPAAKNWKWWSNTGRFNLSRKEGETLRQRAALHHLQLLWESDSATTTVSSLASKSCKNIVSEPKGFKKTDNTQKAHTCACENDS